MSEPLFPLSDDVGTEKQRRILESALEVFAERGFSGSPTAEIARRAGVAEGTIFKHYKTKKDLLLGVVAPLFAKLVAPRAVASVRAIINSEHDTIEAYVRALVMERVSFMRRNERAVRVVIQEIAFHPELRDMLEQTVTALVLNDSIARIQALQARGLVRAGTPMSIIRIVAGTIFSYVLSRVVVFPDREWDDDAEVELMIAVLTRGLAPDS